MIGKESAQQAAGIGECRYGTTTVAPSVVLTGRSVITRYLLNQKEKVSTFGHKIADIYFGGILQGRD
jgi:hypothetical protein